jgi:phosphoglycolate phosphatase-like HAD superfamily hydrolase
MELGFIFFLHQVLFDCTVLYSFPRKRGKSKLTKAIPNLKPYKGMAEALAQLKPLGYRICVISPFTPLSTSNILNHWDIPFNSVVANSDHSNEMELLKSLKKANAKIGLPNKHIFVFCSTAQEIKAVNSLGSISVHCDWPFQEEETIILDASMQISDWSALSAITALFQRPTDHS